MTLALMIACAVCLYIGWHAGKKTEKDAEAKRKLNSKLIIPLSSNCPGCGHPGCELRWNKGSMRVERTCKTCGCQVTQEAVFPDLFKVLGAS